MSASPKHTYADDLPVRSELPGRLNLQELCIAVSSSAGRRSLRSASRGDFAARLLCVWAGHLEFPTAGGSTSHEQC